MANSSGSETKLFKSGVTIHSQARTVTSKVIEGCEIEASQKCLVVPLNQAISRAAFYTGTSRSTIQKIKMEKRKIGDKEVLRSPPKKHSHANPKKICIDDFDKQVIRQTINDFYVIQRKVPTVKKLLPILQSSINFQGKETTLRKILHEMGFMWKKSVNQRKILIERPDIVSWRARYLKQITRLRSEKKNIFFIDETWVDSNLTFKKCWQGPGVTGVVTTVNPTKRLIVVNIGNESGFLTGAGLIYRAGSTVGDYHGQMNYDNFEKWVISKVIPNLPPNSVVVMDNAPFHNLQLNKPPTNQSKKQEMIEWLLKKGVECNSGMRKYVLLDLIKANTTGKTYKIDEIFKLHGHIVLRLPPYMCDLNPIELAWNKIKNYIRNNNVSGNLNLTIIENLTKEALESVTSENWKGFCKKVEDNEKYYWEKDALVEDIIDEFVIDLNNSSSDSSSSSEDDNNYEVDIDLE